MNDEYFKLKLRTEINETRLKNISVLINNIKSICN